jgi:hypothetical protein
MGRWLFARIARRGETSTVMFRSKKIDIRKRLEAAQADVRVGRTLGPFRTASAAMRALKRKARARTSR